MPFHRQRAELRIDDGVRLELERISRSRTESVRRVERAKLLLGYVAGEPISAIARSLKTNRPKVYRCVRKALDVGALPALDDLPRRGRPTTISAGSRAWLVALACRKPAELGYAEELWTVRRLSEHARRHCRDAGHPDLLSVAPGTVSRILANQEVRPHKITYYLERRDPAFDEKMAQVLCFYREVALVRERGEDPDAPLVAYLSYDEKPGIQAVGTTSPDRPPVPGEHATVGRGHEYVRHGTGHLDGRDGPAHGACAPSRGGSASQSGVRRVPAWPGRGLSQKHDAAADPRQPLGAPLQGNAHLARQRAQPVRVRVHAQARIVAEPDRDVLQQSGKNRVAWNPCRLDGRTQGTSRTLHRWD